MARTRARRPARQRRGRPDRRTPAAEAAPPLEASLDSFFTLQGALPASSPATTPSTSLLDQPPPTGTIRGRALIELLRPAYVALGVAGDSDATRLPVSG
ncbi:MAG TPA: hypothetical protein VK611_23845 [Acidimicrobiales bacterium]|nr:hypothetical protein [Acidimicrobiales bacterium]